MEIHLIWAQDSNGGIGKDGKLPWHISEDLKNFKKKKLRNGFYIVNYHHICNHKFPKNKDIPSIYTEIDVFKKHIKFYKENFEIVSLKEGLKILKSNLSTKKKYLSINLLFRLKIKNPQ